MAWYSPSKYSRPVEDVNKKFLTTLKGELSEKEARITLAQFLYRNIGFTTDLLTGVKLYPDQIINIKGMLQSNYSLCIKSRGAGKCLLYDDNSHVLTQEHGLISLPQLIKNVDFHSGERWIDLPLFHIWNGENWCEVSRALIQPKIPSIQVTTKYGYSVSGSINHLVKVWDTKECQVKWKRYHQITTNDYICVNRKESNYPQEPDIDENEAYLIGLLLGVGCFMEDSFTITSADEQILAFIEQFPVGSRIKDKRSKAITIGLKSSFSRELTQKYDLKLVTSYFKEIPAKILKSKSSSAACLRGLFDTDGYADKSRISIEYCSTSYKMAHQIHNLLNLFGIVSRIKTKRTKSKFGKAYCVIIYGKQVNLFNEKIGLSFNKNFVLNLKDEQVTSDLMDDHFYFDKVIDVKDLGEKDCLDFNVPTGERYWANGFINHNTFDAAIFSILQCIFFPKSNVLIAGPTFRTSRFIFNKIEEIVDSPEARLLFQAMGVKSKRNDEFRWRINSGSIVAIPLNGEKIRGFRANVLVIDEFLLMSEDIVEKVLMPYLVAPQDITERQIIREKEDELIRQGILTEEERMDFGNNSKFVGLSSASYTCEYLYKKYDEFVKRIYEPADTVHEGEDESMKEARYFVSQLSWDAVPEDRIDKNIIKLAKSNESNTATFKREYGAQFIDGSDSYFSMNKMITCTVPDGDHPTLLLRGSRTKKYILSIDPNFSNSPTADNFAMCVIEIDEEEMEKGKMSGTVVHNYAKSGKDLKDHIKYFSYLWENFNIEIIIIDYAGYQFIESANESEYFRKKNVEIKIFEFYAEKDGAELEEQLKIARRSLNKENHRIAFTQFFTTDFIRKGNENLQGCIDFKRIWFGAGIKASANAFTSAISANVDLEKVGEANATDFIDTQETLIKQVKYECASIEVKTTAKGTQSFDLPQIMKRDTTSARMRKDSYTALMLGAWGLKCYLDIKKMPKEEETATFSPMLL